MFLASWTQRQKEEVYHYTAYENPVGWWSSNALQRHFYYRYGLETCCYLPDVFTEVLRGTAQPRQMNLITVQTLHAAVLPTHAPLIKPLKPSSFQHVTTFRTRMLLYQCECHHNWTRCFDVSFRLIFRPVGKGCQICSHVTETCRCKCF